MSDVDIPRDTGDFRLIDRRVADVLRSMPERHRHLRGMVAWAGFRQTAVGYRRDPRIAGQSKYNYRQLLRLALEGITSFSVTPLRLVTLLGFLVSLGALSGVIDAMAVRLLTRNWPVGWASLFIAVLFLGGVQLIALGVLGEYRTDLRRGAGTAAVHHRRGSAVTGGGGEDPAREARTTS